MIYSVYLLIGICLIVVQTTIIPFVFYATDFFDLIIPLVLFVSSYNPIEKSLGITLGLGMIMDLLSGGTFGLFLIAYLILSLIVEWIKTYFDTHSMLLLIFLILVGILIEDIIFFLMIGDFFSILSGSVLKSIVWQLIGALLFGFILLLIINKLHDFFRFYQGLSSTLFAGN